MLDLLPLALASAVYPTLLAVVILILSQPKPRRLLAGYLAGAMLTSMTVGMLIVSGLGAGTSIGEPNDILGPGIDIVAGAAALMLFFVLLTNRDAGFRERRRRKRALRATDGRDPWSERLLAHDSIWLAFLVGLALNLPGMMYLVALKDIAAADHSPATNVVLLLAYNLIMFAWAEIPLVGYAISPAATDRKINAIHDWLGAHSRLIAMVLCGVMGAYLFIHGVAGEV